MGDTTNLTMYVHSKDPRVITAARACFENFAGEQNRWTDDYDEAKGEMCLGAGDVSVGNANELACALDELFTKADNEIQCGFCKGEGCENCNGDGVIAAKLPDFAYHVWEDPKYEYLGSSYMHVPEVGDFNGDCDSDGKVVVDTTEVAEWVAKATDLSALQAEVAKLTGATVRKAYEDYQPPEVTNA